MDGTLQSPDCDVPNVVTILHDLSNFPTLADRVQQGMLDFMYLGRAMIHPQGFETNLAFHRAPGVYTSDGTHRLSYDGNSEGCIIGSALTGLERHPGRGVIGVPGMNYSSLLTR